MAGKYSSGRAGQKAPKPQPASAPAPSPAPGLNHEQAKLQTFLKQVRFKRAFFGVDEADVWKRIGELNQLYEAALSAERARYDALLEQQKSGGDGYSD